jgi:hypothetical protein
VWPNCPINGGWLDQRQVRFLHGMLRVSRCSVP